MEYLVERIKAEIFSPSASSSTLFVSASAYDTAWVAMIPHPDHPHRPMFQQCLEWILSNQNTNGDDDDQDGCWGFWGEPQHHPLHCLTSTLACLVAIETWIDSRNAATSPHIQKGLKFLHANIEKLLIRNINSNKNTDCVKSSYGSGVYIPGWFAIVFPGMLELAESKGLLSLSEVMKLSATVKVVFTERQRLLSLLGDEKLQLPLDLYAYLEVLLPSQINIHRAKHVELVLGPEEIVKQYQSPDGSLFQSPSATAAAFMATGNNNCFRYLQCLIDTCGHAVPPIYPIGEGVIKLCLVDHLQRLGCADHFREEISEVMDHAYYSWMKEPQVRGEHGINWMRIYNDSLAFRLLRMHGFNVSPSRFCWFAKDDEMMLHIEQNYSYFLETMYSIYRASHLQFPNEPELEKAKSFAYKVLKKCLPPKHSAENDEAILDELKKEIKHELKLPWLARMDHLEHRAYIENGGTYNMWIGKTSYCRLSEASTSLQLELAKRRFSLRQLVYKDELEELKRWSKNVGLSEMGFGREKTVYCYFAMAVMSSLPITSHLRSVVAKSAILTTVTDDFFDEKASLEDLHTLTNAVLSWQGEGLSGSSAVIFDALDGLVTEIALMMSSAQQDHHDMKIVLKDMWREIFESWLQEAVWSRNRHAPSIDEYLSVGMVSIGVAAMLLPSCLLLSPNYLHQNWSTKHHYSMITKLLMLICRLLNDTQSYEKELEDGKLNMVALYLRENRKGGAEGAIARVRSMVDARKKEFLELVKSDHNYNGDLPLEVKDLHLTCLKGFQMLFNSSNVFDSDTALLESINLALYKPLRDCTVNNVNPLTPPSSPSSSRCTYGSKKISSQLLFQEHGRCVKMVVRGPRHHCNGVFTVKPIRTSKLAFTQKSMLLAARSPASYMNYAHL